jgi:hypothetical protein
MDVCTNGADTADDMVVPAKKQQAVERITDFFCKIIWRNAVIQNGVEARSVCAANAKPDFLNSSDRTPANTQRPGNGKR